ncbi:hypothetical protein [Paludibacterium paludis]|uniref:Uncharacterized protein n=1 Tax=Paludibacterium paludis TaxID=1225769 RepID=A0A918P6J1_9NEIS|nr:hypothetical protein [Paludibacterium paludis]GGY26452.1 hypothetical protein GCM10011289_32480 [Paludibacterium paludis]
MSFSVFKSCCSRRTMSITPDATGHKSRSALVAKLRSVRNTVARMGSQCRARVASAFTRVKNWLAGVSRASSVVQANSEQSRGDEPVCVGQESQKTCRISERTLYDEIDFSDDEASRSDGLSDALPPPPVEVLAEVFYNKRLDFFAAERERRGRLSTIAEESEEVVMGASCEQPQVQCAARQNRPDKVNGAVSAEDVLAELRQALAKRRVPLAESSDSESNRSCSDSDSHKNSI